MRIKRSALGLITVLALACAHVGGALAGERIVSSGGAVTEILYAIGAEPDIVAVDASSLHPERALKEKPSIGYMRALSPEGVLSVAPSIVIASEGSGPPDALKVVREAGIRVELISDAFAIDALLSRIRVIGALAGRADAAERLASEVKAGFEAVAPLASPTVRKKVLFVLALQNNRPMVGGRSTAADAIIRLAGADNAAAEIDGYKPMTEEAIAATRPDVVLMMTRPGVSALSADDLFVRPAFATTPAAGRRALITMDGLYLLGFGPRTPQAIRELATEIGRLTGGGKS